MANIDVAARSVGVSLAVCALFAPACSLISRANVAKKVEESTKSSFSMFPAFETQVTYVLGRLQVN